MTRAARGALIGGAVGALVAVAQTVRAEDDPPQVVAIQAVRGAAQGAVVGALVGWTMDRVAAAKVAGVAYADVAREAWTDAAGSAEHVVDVVRPRVQGAVAHAAAVARRSA